MSTMASATSTVKTSAAMFPLRTVNEVRNLFASQCVVETNQQQHSAEPDLVLLSIVAGYIENSMSKINEVNLLTSELTATTSEAAGADSTGSGNCSIDYGGGYVTTANLKIEPQVEWHYIESLQKKFEAVIRGYCDLNLLNNARQEEADPQDVRKLIKHVADIIWNTLSKAQYKDRPHLQSIYSYLTGNKLDCFGVAFAVVASCQLLEVPGVHLALSEDHAWVVFGKNGTETAEVTWHGKGNEDKRGQPVDIVKAKTSWLYVAGQPVVCDRYMEVAALVSSINPAINSNYDSIEIGALQQELLWLLYDHGYLKNYPMALGNLGDLEEISPSIGRPSSSRLFEEAIEVNRRVYNDHHVYPYTYLAGYYYRMKEYNKALETWANAADVIKLYSYSKDDEEIYKEFMEIANELIPHVIKAEDPKVQNDPVCFANILRFYDGICCWEEGSTTPVMHIGWAKPMVSTCSKFDAKIRKKVELPESEANCEPETDTEELLWVNNNYYKTFDDDDCDNDDDDLTEKCRENVKVATSPAISGTSTGSTTSSRSCGSTYEVEPNKCAKDQVLSLLSEYCHSKVLNLDYLLGLSSQPFSSTCTTSGSTTSGSTTQLSTTTPRITQPRIKTTDLKRPHLLSGRSTPPPPEDFNFTKKRIQPENLAENSNSTTPMLSPSGSSTSSTSTCTGTSGSTTGSTASKVMLRLHSAKMIGLKDLINSEKLNTNAIQLQLTALSQVNTSSKNEFGKLNSGFELSEGGGRPKRSRRE